VPSPLPSLPLSAKLTVLRGVGPAFAAALGENGLETVRDLLWSLPHRYVDRGSLLKIGELERRPLHPELDREIVTVLGVVTDLRQTNTAA